MSTRSYICIERPNGKYQGIYCHSDGYLTYNGAMLLDNYNEREKVEKIISLGDISTLQENIDPNPNYPHSFDDRQSHVTVFYGRDRGENKNIISARDVTLDEINRPDSWIEYCYVYGLDNKWKYFVCAKQKHPELKDLEEGLKEEYEAFGFERPKGYYGFYTPEDIKMLKEKDNQMQM